MAILWPRNDDLSRKRGPWPTLDPGQDRSSRVNPGPLEVIWKAGWTRDGSEKAKGRECMHVANSFFVVSIENGSSGIRVGDLGPISAAPGRHALDVGFLVCVGPTAQVRGSVRACSRTSYVALARMHRPARPTGRCCDRRGRDRPGASVVAEDLLHRRSDRGSCKADACQSRHGRPDVGMRDINARFLHPLENTSGRSQSGLGPSQPHVFTHTNPRRA